jgi:hypothetical protein
MTETYLSLISSLAKIERRASSSSVMVLSELELIICIECGSI